MIPQSSALTITPQGHPPTDFFTDLIVDTFEALKTVQWLHEINTNQRIDNFRMWTLELKQT